MSGGSIGVLLTSKTDGVTLTDLEVTNAEELVSVWMEVTPTS